MIDLITFTIDGKPTPWKRPRRNRNAYFSSREQRDIKNAIAGLAVESMTQNDFTKAPMGCPIIMEVFAYFEMPPSWSKKKRRAMQDNIYHTQTPDADNVGKLIKDALNGVVYHDDRQVSCLSVSKFWSLGPSKTVVQIRKIPLYISAISLPESPKNDTENKRKTDASNTRLADHNRPKLKEVNHGD